MRAVALRDELTEIRKSLQDGEPETEGELPDSRLADAFKRIGNQSGLASWPAPEVTPIKPPHAAWLEQMDERRDQLNAEMEAVSERIAEARRAEVEREKAMLSALETVASELELANASEAEPVGRERWMLCLTIASVAFSAIAAAAAILALTSA
jgi:hypothetical protein